VFNLLLFVSFFFLCLGTDSYNLEFGDMLNLSPWPAHGKPGALFVNLFALSESTELFNFVINNKYWPKLQRFKKHRNVDHWKPSTNKEVNNDLEFIKFRKKWEGVSGIYKITFLPCKIFTYYGSSKNLGQRLKHHRYNTLKESSFLGVFLSTFGWLSFSITIIEVLPQYSDKLLREREDWYLKTFMPLLNMQTSSNSPARDLKMSPITRLKIRNSLLGKKHTKLTRTKMSINRSGNKSHWHGKRLPDSILDAAAEVNGIKVYVYDSKTFSLVNNKPFRSVRSTVKSLPISATKLTSILDTGLEFKGYFYFTAPQSSKPN
jgi:group I intron endonuclease